MARRPTRDRAFPGARSMSFFRSILRTTLVEAIRNRLLWLAVIVIAAALGLAQFLNQVAITESLEIQASLVAALLRVAAVFMVVTFVITSVVRESNDKVTELILSQAVPRSAYFFGRLAGFFVVAMVLALLFGLPLAFFAPPARLAPWTLSLACELLVMVSVSLFCVLSLTQVLSAFAATSAFYLLSRSMAAMQVIASAPIGEHGIADQIVALIVNGIAIILPSLDRMTQTSWLVEAAPSSQVLGTLVLHSALYIVLIASAALFDLYRKNY